MKKIEGKEKIKFFKGKRLYLNDLVRIVNIIEGRNYLIEFSDRCLIS